MQIQRQISFDIFFCQRLPFCEGGWGFCGEGWSKGEGSERRGGAWPGRLYVERNKLCAEI